MSSPSGPDRRPATWPAPLAARPPAALSPARVRSSPAAVASSLVPEPPDLSFQLGDLARRLQLAPEGVQVRTHRGEQGNRGRRRAVALNEGAQYVVASQQHGALFDGRLAGPFERSMDARSGGHSRGRAERTPSHPRRTLREDRVRCIAGTIDRHPKLRQHARADAASLDQDAEQGVRRRLHRRMSAGRAACARCRCSRCRTLRLPSGRS